MNALLIMLDGIADRSQVSLGGKTPLQAADIPNLDRLAASGMCGHMYPVSPGTCASSDMALWRMLGYGACPYPGRAGIEAFGAGVPMEDGDAIFRVNMAKTLEQGGLRYVQAAPAYLPADEAAQIFEALAAYEPEHFDSRLHHLGGPFMALVLSGGASRAVTDSDPLFYRNPVPQVLPLDGQGEEAAMTADELNRFAAWAAETIESHPVCSRRREEGMTAPDYVLLKWPSAPPRVPDFEEAWGFKAVSLARGAFYAGLSAALGMEDAFSADVLDPPEDAGRDLEQKVGRALEAFGSGRDFAFVHTKAPDEAAHTGKPSRKAAVCEELDTALDIVAAEVAGDPDILTVITADHATPSGGSDEVIHSGESVPLVMTGINVRVDAVGRFDEVSCAGGALGLLNGVDLMPLILNFTDRARFACSRLTPREIPYKPRA